MGKISVNYPELAKARMVCEMQSGHLRKIGDFIAEHCRIDAEGETGWMLIPLVGIYTQARTDAEGGFASATQAVSGTATGTQNALDGYVDFENEVVEMLGGVAGALVSDASGSGQVTGGEGLSGEGLVPPIGGSAAYVPSWLKDANKSVAQDLRDFNFGRGIYDHSAKAVGWGPESSDSQLGQFTKGLNDLRPTTQLKNGLTWMEEQWRNRHEPQGALTRQGEIWASPAENRQFNRQLRFAQGYDSYLRWEESQGHLIRDVQVHQPRITSMENVQTLGRGFTAASQTVGLVTGVVGIVDGADVAHKSWERNGRVQDVANGGGYGDVSLQATGTSVPDSVRELEDPQSALSSVPTSGEKDIGESLRWRAGLLLGGLDWLISQIVDPGPIELLVRPFSGDWKAIDVSRLAWGQAAVAVGCVGRNIEGLPTMLGTWEGEAKTAFTSRSGEISDALYDFGDGCLAMSDVSGALLDLAKMTGESIATILGVLGDWLTRLAIEAAIPIAGWIAGAIDIAATATQMTMKINQGLQLMKKFLDAIERVLEVIKVINQVIIVIRSLERSITAIGNIGTVTAGDDAARTAFALD